MRTNSELLANGLITTGLSLMLSIGMIILHYLVFKRLLINKTQDISKNKSYFAFQLAIIFSIFYCIYLSYIPISNALGIIRMNQLKTYSSTLQCIAGYAAVTFAFSLIHSAIVIYFISAFFKTNPKKIIEDDNWRTGIIVSAFIVALIIIDGYGLQSILQAFLPKLETPKIN